MKHRCQVDGCELMVPRDQLMCFGHWRKVPGELQRIVLAQWNGGEISATYMQAREAAIQAVDKQRVAPASAPASRGRQLMLL